MFPIGVTPGSAQHKLFPGRDVVIGSDARILAGDDIVKTFFKRLLWRSFLWQLLGKRITGALVITAKQQKEEGKGSLCQRHPRWTTSCSLWS